MVMYLDVVASYVADLLKQVARDEVADWLKQVARDEVADWLKQVARDEVAYWRKQVARDEGGMLLGVSGEINKMSAKLGDLRAFLAEADRRRITGQLMKRWVMELKDAMHDATDIQGLCQLRVMVRGPSMGMRFYSLLLFFLPNPLFARDIANRIKAFNRTLDDLKERSAAFSFVNLGSYEDRSRCLTGSEPMKLVEKKRKTSDLHYAPGRFKVIIKKSTRSSGVPAAPNQNIPQEDVLEDEVIEEALEQASVPELAQDPVGVSTMSTGAEVPEDTQQVPTPAGNSPRVNKFPFCPRFIEDKELDEAWGRISDRQAGTGPDLLFAEYNDVSIRHMVESYAVVGRLTQRIKLLEQKNSELVNSEKIKEEVVAKEARITKLEEECQAKDRSMEYLTTWHKEVIDTFEKKNQEQTQALRRAEKTLQFERGQAAELERSLEDKIKALNKMLFDMGSGSQLPNLKDPAEKINFLGQQLEDLKSLLNFTRENHAQTMKEAVANGVSFALAKLRASDLSTNLQVVEEDFNCSIEEATKFLEEVKPLGDKVAEEMEVESPSRSDQSSGPKE